ncbi:D-Ala-D-Ala carboxypeptidase family metallohydrolase [Kordiimonas pumila]|uniref:D-Ala-D-Ala carboxypeptidase family metallohydrolase n=1 Tax=Kordiimonas pumila TaxID=2161677 RepID=A0ABV7D406_9PROT|nr:D-Ala-D-Ala carboxypeptidase family metallohydrolase [Kordiimonas pumila]
MSGYRLTGRTGYNMTFDQSEALSPHFTLRELTRSKTAEAQGLYNIPREVSEHANLKALAECVLEPARLLLNAPLIITSGYRCATLNRLIGGARNSQHMLGEAADFIPRGLKVADAAFTLAALDTLPFDQLIYEMRERTGKELQQWVHISHRRMGGNRREVLTFFRSDNGEQQVAQGIKPLEHFVSEAEHNAA